jgi:hypothetical protein
VEWYRCIPRHDLRQLTPVEKATEKLMRDL